MSIIADNLTHAVFIKEQKNRFICEVELSGRSVECYVPSSCRLSNFIELKGKSVLVQPTNGYGARTEYSLIAIPYKHSYILLNSSLANRIVESSIMGRRFSFLGKRLYIQKEQRIEGYKTDLFITDSKTIIEVKSLISMDASACFPTVYSERAINQLKLLLDLLHRGYNACYLIISLNPYVKEVLVDIESEQCKLLRECISHGMMVKGFSCRLKDGNITLNKIIPVYI
jgi:DNA-binding sugar fermentation-stimulating protein